MLFLLCFLDICSQFVCQHICLVSAIRSLCVKAGTGHMGNILIRLVDYFWQLVYGKDKIIFVTKEDHETPSSAELVADDPNDPYEDHGLILPSGDINWNCPCLGGMASGPCGEQFKSAFSCFHYSTEEIKGSDCVEQFRGMQECMQRYPDLYPQEDEEEEKDNQKTDAERPPLKVESSSTKDEGTS
ncbi:mitochondrial intermembrane space import and assembly protein 40 isoform X2 [Lissotriton helveticus]